MRKKRLIISVLSGKDLDVLLKSIGKKLKKKWPLAHKRQILGNEEKLTIALAVATLSAPDCLSTNLRISR